MNALDRILKARSILVLDHPFFGSLALRLKLTENKSIETACTDGTELRYNPQWVDSLAGREPLGFVAHEVMHNALGHTWRKGNRQGRRWNLACDYTINENLVAAGFTLPKGNMINEAYRDKSAEEIYELLQKQEEQEEQKPKAGDAKSQENKQGQSSGQDDKTSENQKQGEEESPQDKGSKDKDDKGNNKDDSNQDPGGCGAVTAPEEMSKAKEQEMKATWQAAVAQAIQVSKGSVPAGIKRQAEAILNPTLPWYILLRDFVERAARNDYDWTRPSRRYICSDIILPSLISEQLPEIVIAIDTSGSIDEEQLSKFAVEASNVLGAYDTTITVIYCDAKIHKVDIFTRADLPMKMKPVGGGGTDFKPVFEYVEKQYLTPACLIYFTDLNGYFPKKEPYYPTMWLTTDKDEKAPFGITVNF